MPETGQLSDFIDGLGPGQLVGRQVLGAPSLGDIQLSLCHQKGYLEVEVIRARGLQMKPGAKSTPGKYSRYYAAEGHQKAMHSIFCSCRGLDILERRQWAAILRCDHQMHCSLRTTNLGHKMAAPMVMHHQCLLSCISRPLILW